MILNAGGCRGSFWKYERGRVFDKSERWIDWNVQFSDLTTLEF